MTKFENALDDAFEELKAKLGRVPFLDEVEGLRQRFFQSWKASEKFDELIEYIHDYYELEGGFGDCAILSEALKRSGDLKGIEKLFQKLIAARTEAFWRAWPNATTGHIGAMRESAKHMAAAMEAYAGLWHGYWSLSNEPGQQRVQSEMLQFQERVKPKPVKRRAK